VVKQNEMGKKIEHKLGLITARHDFLQIR